MAIGTRTARLRPRVPAVVALVAAAAVALILYFLPLAAHPGSGTGDAAAAGSGSGGRVRGVDPVIKEVDSKQQQARGRPRPPWLPQPQQPGGIGHVGRPIGRPTVHPSKELAVTAFSAVGRAEEGRVTARAYGDDAQELIKRVFVSRQNFCP
ncbi:hypothetical protein ACP70R_021021 [Stipagrostis hirtigluma subsp. patula]